MSSTENECINEINELKDISLLDIVQYIKNSIDVIVTLKIEEKKNEYKSKKNENAATDYETLLQKEEAAIRQHISYEHQIKIEYEKLLEKLEVMDLENKLLLYQIVRIIFLMLYNVGERQNDYLAEYSWDKVAERISSII